MASNKIVVDGVSYIREECSSLRVIDNNGSLYCNICGCLVNVSDAVRRDVKRINVHSIEPYMITGHPLCVDLYKKRC